jgi:hypothetical protein
MPERPDLRKIATDIREALSSYPREALADILTYVFQAYVVEGAPTVAAPQPERVQDLEGLSFADVIQTLQLRLELPELSLFEVANGRVSVRVGGELQPLVLGADARRVAAAPLPPSGSAPQPAATPPVAVAAAPVARAAAEAPRPTRGLSVNPPTPGGAAAPARPTAPPPAQAATAARPVPNTDEPADDDAASKRFKLLEID